jgi:hypothetical protein
MPKSCWDGLGFVKTPRDDVHIYRLPSAVRSDIAALAVIPASNDLAEDKFRGMRCCYHARASARAYCAQTPRTRHVAGRKGDVSASRARTSPKTPSPAVRLGWRRERASLPPPRPPACNRLEFSGRIAVAAGRACSLPSARRARPARVAKPFGRCRAGRHEFRRT